MKMPSLDYMDEKGESCITGASLVEQIRADSRKPPVLLVDCRSAVDFRRNRLSGSINVSLPASHLMLRRLANGKLQIASLIRDDACRQKFVSQWKTHTVVIYDAESEDLGSRMDQSVLLTLYRRLEQDGCRVVCLQGFNRFSTDFPEWCESGSDTDTPLDASLLGLETLRITPSNSSPSSSSATSTSSGSESECDSGLPMVVGGGGGGGGRGPGGGGPLDPPFPVEIVPYLFLGNADNASDFGALERHHIQHILNVTPDLPNAFEKKGLGIRYLQIPIMDHWSQNLAVFFPQAIAFIDEARTRRQGVLVHCLAGVSRSVTVTLAYLMRTLRLPLNDAYELVRRRKANISPNFHFLGQLLDYEGQLRLTPSSGQGGPPTLVAQQSPLLFGHSPTPGTVVPLGSGQSSSTSVLDVPGALVYGNYPCTCPGTCPCSCSARRNGEGRERTELPPGSGVSTATSSLATTPMSAPPCPCATRSSALYFTSPAHATPDSGIDVDRWTE